MLTQRPGHRPSRGFTLIELMVVMVVMALMVVGFAPDMARWIANSKVRGTAESLESEIRLAQLEALRRNRQAVFVLTNATPAVDASPTGNALNWYVRALPTPDEAAEKGFDATPLFVHGSTQAREAGVQIGGPAMLCFNASGRPVAQAATPVGKTTACTAPSNSATPVAYTVARGGADRTLQVQVALGGHIRLCDLSKARSDGAADACQ